MAQKFELLNLATFEDAFEAVLDKLDDEQVQSDNITIIVKSIKRDPRGKIPVNVLVYVDSTPDEILNDLNK